MYWYSAVVETVAMGSVGPLLCEWLVPLLIYSGVGECKGCDPCGQLLCGVLQAPSAVQALHTHSMAAHGRRTGAYKIIVATQWVGQLLCYSLIQLIGLGYSIDIVWRYFLKHIKSC